MTFFVTHSKIVLCAHIALFCGSSEPPNRLKKVLFYAFADDKTHGIGVKKDKVSGFSYYMKAAEKGSSMAAYNIGCGYRHGDICHSKAFTVSTEIP